MRASAIQRVNSTAFQLTQTIQNGVQVMVHQTKKHTPDQKIETCECQHGSGLKIFLSALHFQLTALFQQACAEQFAQTMASVCSLDDLVQRFQPLRDFGFYFSQNRLQNLGHRFEVTIHIVQTHRRREREKLHEQKINLVAVKGA